MNDDMDHNFLELNRHEKQHITQNFQFYVRNKGGSVNQIERFELPMVLEGKLGVTDQLQRAVSVAPRRS